jgi:Chaperone of endosialidase
LSLLLFVIATSYAQNVLIGPGYSQVQNTTSGQPLSVGMRPGYTGYLDFKRGASFSAGILNSGSPKQLKMGIANSNSGVDYYNDIVIDSTNRYIGFGTNNPGSKFHFYAVGGSSDGDLRLESDTYPFITLKDKIIGNEGIEWKSSNDGIIGYLFHSSSLKKMFWGFGNSAIEVVIDSTTRNVGLGISSPTSKLHTYNDRGTSIANVRIENTGSAFVGISLKNIASTTGVNLYGTASNGLNVADLNGVGFTPVNASAFNVTSDANAKKEIDYLGNDDYDTYITQIRDIKSATYRYNWENARTRTTPHIGFIAQSLPNAVVTEMNVSPDGSNNEKYVGYNLSDMAGLTVMGIKAVDARTLKLEETIKAQQAQIDVLIKEIEKLKK